MAFVTNTLSGLNTNSLAAVTASLNVQTQSSIAWTVQGATGTHASHEITLQLSLDNINWINTSSVLARVDVLSVNTDLVIGYVRFCVTKLEGATSTVNIVVNTK